MKLSLEQVAEIRSLDGQITQKKIAAQFGVSQQHVCKIITGVKRGPGVRPPKPWGFQRINVVSRFLSKVGPPDKNGCRNWTGCRCSDGYGMFRFNGKTIGAHIVSAVAFYGPVPSNMEVCHHCDNPPCVNPSHLFFGTDADNVHDAMQKGLRVPQHHPRKLDVIKVLLIRSSTMPSGYLANLYHVSGATIWAVRKRRIWRHIP